MIEKSVIVWLVYHSHVSIVCSLSIIVLCQQCGFSITVLSLECDLSITVLYLSQSLSTGILLFFYQLLIHISLSKITTLEEKKECIQDNEITWCFASFSVQCFIIITHKIILTKNHGIFNHCVQQTAICSSA